MEDKRKITLDTLRKRVQESRGKIATRAKLVNAKKGGKLIRLTSIKDDPRFAEFVERARVKAKNVKPTTKNNLHADLVERVKSRAKGIKKVPASLQEQAAGIFKRGFKKGE